MSTPPPKTNVLGQEIKVGDRVIYIGYTLSYYVGKLIGWTYAGHCQLELDRKVKKVKYRWNQKVYNYYDSEPWDRRPHSHVIYPDGQMVHLSQWHALPWRERSAVDVKWDEGQLREGYEIFEVPALFTGPKGIERLFKFEK